MTEIKRRLAAAASSGGDDHECCVPVVDSNTFIFTIGGAAVAVWFLRFNNILMFIISMFVISVFIISIWILLRNTIISTLRRKRRSAPSGNLLFEGRRQLFYMCPCGKNICTVSLFLVENRRKSFVNRKCKGHNTCVMAVSCMTCSRQKISPQHFASFSPFLLLLQ